jgi:hypothetical protein
MAEEIVHDVQKLLGRGTHDRFSHRRRPPLPGLTRVLQGERLHRPRRRPACEQLERG